MRQYNGQNSFRRNGRQQENAKYTVQLYGLVNLRRKNNISCKVARDALRSYYIRKIIKIRPQLLDVITGWAMQTVNKGTSSIFKVAKKEDEYRRFGCSLLERYIEGLDDYLYNCKESQLTGVRQLYHPIVSRNYALSKIYEECSRSKDDMVIDFSQLSEDYVRRLVN